MASAKYCAENLGRTNRGLKNWFCNPQKRSKMSISIENVFNVYMHFFQSFMVTYLRATGDMVRQRYNRYKRRLPQQHHEVDDEEDESEAVSRKRRYVTIE